MHTIADARRLIPAPSTVESKPQRSHGSIKKPLECAASLASKKGCAVVHTPLEIQSTKFDQKRSLRQDASLA